MWDLHFCSVIPLFLNSKRDALRSLIQSSALPHLEVSRWSTAPETPADKTSVTGNCSVNIFAINENRPLARLWKCSAANLEDSTIRFFLHMRIDLNSQKRKFLLFCPPDWLHSHYVQGVYFDAKLMNFKPGARNYLGVNWLVSHQRLSKCRKRNKMALNGNLALSENH